MTEEEFTALEEGDEVVRGFPGSGEKSCFIAELERAGGCGSSWSFRILEVICDGGNPNVVVGNEWFADESSAYKYRHHHADTPVAAVAGLASHMAGLDPEEIDWDAYKAFMDSLQG